MILASEADLHLWGNGSRGRFDYITDDYTLEEIEKEGETFFSRCIHRLKSDDLVCIRDAGRKSAEYVIDSTDMSRRRVYMSRMTAFEHKPIVQDDADYRINWKGPKGGGFRIFDKAGKMVERDHKGDKLPALTHVMKKEEAELIMGNLVSARALQDAA